MEDLSMMKILVVDDIEENIDVLIELLSDDFGLACFPRELRWELMGIVPSGGQSTLAINNEAEESIASK